MAREVMVDHEGDRHADAGERLERYQAPLVARYSHEAAKAPNLHD